MCVNGTVEVKPTPNAPYPHSAPRVIDCKMNIKLI